MKNLKFILAVIFALSGSCTSEKKLAYLNNLPETGGIETFVMEIPDYRVQPRDILYITLKAMTPDGFISDFLGVSSGGSSANYIQSESGGYLYGYDVKKDGKIIIPVLDSCYVAGKTTEEIRNFLQEEFSKSFKNAIVECKLIGYKFTVMGDVKNPGTFINYNNYLTVFEAIGRAGGVDDYGRRDRVIVVRIKDEGTVPYYLNLQDKSILSSPGYFILPNDVIIIEPQKNKTFILNLPVFTFIVTTITSTVTMTLLLINYFE